LLTFQNGSATDGAYGYDAFSRLVQRRLIGFRRASRSSL
jgi:YD repeat-containing protein